MNLLIKTPYIFSYRLPHTLEEAASIVSISDLSFIVNLPGGGGDRMEMAYDLAYNMLKASSIISLVFAGRGDVLAPGNPLKERDA